MFEYELPIAVVTLDKKEILPAGTFLTSLLPKVNKI